MIDCFLRYQVEFVFVIYTGYPAAMALRSKEHLGDTWILLILLAAIFDLI